LIRNSTLYITPHGLTTSALLQIDFDFISHLLIIVTFDNPTTKTISLRPYSVAEFYQEIMTALRSLGIIVSIWTTSVEIPDRTPFEQDTRHKSYDPDYVQRFWQILTQASRVLSVFRSRFIGKVRPVHFFWGTFDLAITRKHPGVPYCAHFVMAEAYSHEVVVVSGLEVSQSTNLSSMLTPILSHRISASTISNQRGKQYKSISYTGQIKKGERRIRLITTWNLSRLFIYKPFISNSI
jgi:Family of unknown function (DUF5996)